MTVVLLNVLMQDIVCQFSVEILCCWSCEVDIQYANPTNTTGLDVKTSMLWDASGLFLFLLINRLLRKYMSSIISLYYTGAKTLVSTENMYGVILKSLFCLFINHVGSSVFV